MPARMPAQHAESVRHVAVEPDISESIANSSPGQSTGWRLLGHRSTQSRYFFSPRAYSAVIEDCNPPRGVNSPFNVAHTGFTA